MNTRIYYMYRDGSNYKQLEEVVIPGAISEEDKKIILDARDEGSYFIPSQVGLNDLQERMISFPNDDDHVWHELDETNIILTEDDPTPNHEFSDIKELVERFRGIKWDIEQAMTDNGL